MKCLANHILSMGIASMLVLCASGLAIAALTTVPAFAINNNDDNNNSDDDDNNNYNTHERQYNNTDELQFLIAVIWCFANNDNNNDQDQPFSYEVEQCLYDVIDQYFYTNNDQNNNDNQDNNNVANNDDNNNDDNQNNNDMAY
jgi:hypothetical protein